MAVDQEDVAEQAAEAAVPDVAVVAEEDAVVVEGDKKLHFGV